jgi:hypothetical protein
MKCQSTISRYHALSVTTASTASLLSYPTVKELELNYSPHSNYKLLSINVTDPIDYYFVLDKKMNGKQRTSFIIQQYLDGLLHLTEKYKNDKKMKIRGTSFIINKITAEKIGFEIIETDILQKIILIYNYFNILISNSIAKHKLSFPTLNKTKTFDVNMSQLLEQKEYIEKLNKSLKSTIASTVYN